MKIRSLFLTISTLFCCLIITGVSGQTIAVGHVSAEIVEAVSASSSVSAGFNLDYSNSGNSHENTAMIAENVSLGSIHISSGQNIACNLTVKPANLVDEKGNGFSLEPIANYDGKQESQRVDGSQTIELAGLARLDANQASGLYHGSYTLVFAYN
jgi:hypothetical protein